MAYQGVDAPRLCHLSTSPCTAALLKDFLFTTGAIFSMAAFTFSRLAVPGVSLLIIFLAYTSQVLFLYLEPAPLSGPELIQFNLLVLCMWICYLRACMTNPGSVPQDWALTNAANGKEDISDADGKHSRRRWCRKCEAFKPPRAHHCKSCGRSVMAH